MAISVDTGSQKMEYTVYILSNHSATTLYVGVTNDLLRRLEEHRSHANPKSFTAKYNVTRLVYYENTNDVFSAIEREKQIKGWNRKRKEALVESVNPGWKDLTSQVFEE